jgi:hypothetical protein
MAWIGTTKLMTAVNVADCLRVVQQRTTRLALLTVLIFANAFPKPQRVTHFRNYSVLFHFLIPEMNVLFLSSDSYFISVFLKSFASKSGGKWSEDLWCSMCIILDLHLRSLYVGYSVVCCLICFVPFVLFYVVITRFMFLFLVSYVLLSILCVLCFRIVCLHVYNCLFSICVQVYWPLPLGGNPVAVNKYFIIMYTHTHTHTHISYVMLPPRLNDFFPSQPA